MKEETDKLVVENLYKIFGPQPEQAFELLESGQSKAEILEETGLTVGVQDTSFAVKAGEIFVVMGLSGSGKSTLVRMLNRLVEPTRGEVSIDGENITQCDMKTVRDIRLRKMAMVFQHFALFPHMTVVDNAAYGLRVQGVHRKERRDTAMQALEQVGLEAWAKRSPNALSGGMQQRVGLARGLAVNPDILLMDEPFSALDPLIRHDMQLELLELQRNVQQTIVFITHDLNEALILGDRIAIMKDGQFVQVGTAQEIVSDPADDYVAAFTKDIDRGRVFTAEYVMTKPAPLNLDTDTPQTAMEKMNELDRSGLYAMRGDSIRGVVTYRDTADHAARHENDLSAIVRAEYPTVTADTYLYQVYDQCSYGLPIAVLDGDGVLQGAVEPIRVFSQLCADDEQQARSGNDHANTATTGPETVTEAQQ